MRALKVHSGRFKVVSSKPLPVELDEENLPALEQGAANLKAHIDIVHRFGVPVVVCINRFPSDTPAEIDLVGKIALEAGAEAVAVSESFPRGADGGKAPAEAVRAVCRATDNHFHPLYAPDASLQDKIEAIATQVYGAGEVRYEAGVRSRLKLYERWGFRRIPVCFAKTQFSLSESQGCSTGVYSAHHGCSARVGARFVRVLCGDIMTMPGLPAEPAAVKMDVAESGQITGASW